MAEEIKNIGQTHPTDEEKKLIESQDSKDPEDVGEVVIDE